MKPGIQPKPRWWTGLAVGLLLISLLSGCAADTGSPPGTSGDTVSLAVYCRIAIDAGLAGLPEDGVMLAPVELDWVEDETVAQLLERAAREQKLAVSSQGSGSMKFIVSIGGLAAVDGRSGWMFSVNGEIIMVGSGTVKVEAGDHIEWHYTMDSGSDLS